MSKLQDKIEEIKKIAAQENINIDIKYEEIKKEIQSKSQKKKAWDYVQLARHIERPTTLDYINNICEEFIEFHGDRYFMDDKAIVSGIGLIDGNPVTIIGHQKGRNTEENIERNFGMAHPEGYRKALRLMKQAEKFNRPIINLIDTPGAYCGLGAEERGQSEAIAKNLFEMIDLETPILSIIIGEGGSGGALGLGVANDVWMLENSIYSVISPEGFSSILLKDASKASHAAEMMKIISKDLKALKLIDKVIDEPEGGAHKDLEKMSQILKAEIVHQLEVYKDQAIETLVEKRYNKFRNYGEFNSAT